MKLVFVSGLSGAGKTVALKQYEDIGYYCIDNLPLQLVGPFIRRALRRSDGRYEKLAIGIDARETAPEIARFPKYLESLRAQNVQVHVLFLRADDSVLLQRYSETRRRHPLAQGEISLSDAVRLERQLLAPIANAADATIDTSNKNLHALREEIQGLVPGGGGKLSLMFMSFGFKNGIPEDADFVFDIRAIPNPHWQAELRTLTGRDTAVVAWIEQQPIARRLFADIQAFLARWLPEYQKQDRAYLTVAIGCTGGQHRSVYFVEKLGEAFRGRFEHLAIRHRELWLPPATPAHGT
ncbi:RNase adapter RapZ [Solimonas terrae]|uniref:RNase adapter RapZ n=1 Tax=Solimonas terrae TaxID=1396819 RepID=A0A6M2BU13_9GAMM|nr:RNase adapter RapZ [Solimonas terrae]NGY05437.1 RNase adapter RapZ [Solimonas terrae]